MERDDAESLKEFLAQQSDVGKTVVRSDHFTISPQKAWDKLSAHALPFKEAWVLEVVQAAVLANCTSIKVTQTTARTTLRLHREELWDPEQILEALLNFEAHSATYLHRLAVALRVLAKTLGHPFGVYTARRKVFGWTGDELEVGNDKFDLPEENSQVGDLIISVSNSANEDRSIFSKIFKLEERTFVANISALLYRRAFCCPIPLTVDSRSVRGLQAYLQPSQGCASRPLLLLHVPSSEKLPAFLAPSFESWEVAPADAPVAVRVNSESSAAPVDQTVSNGPALQFGQVGVVVVLRAFLARESTKDSFMQKNSKTSAWMPGQGMSILLWVRNGVVVQEEELPSGTFGFLILASAEGLKTDLSGYNLVRNSQFLDRRNCVISATKGTLLKTLESSDFKHIEDVKLGVFDFLFRILCTGVGMGLIVPGLVFLADLAYGVLMTKALGKESAKAFEQEFSSFLESLKDARRPLATKPE